MGYVSPVGRNWGPVVNWDDLGKFYASIAIAWTVILCIGMAWLVANRNLPFLKMRNIPLVIAATSFLHIYLVKILLAYTTNGHFPCAAEFWIMSIYLPFGVALFQANMVQLLNISSQQRKLLEGDRASIRGPLQHPAGIRGIWSRWKTLNPNKKTYILIGIGMLLQVILTAAIYGTSPKLQGHWGKIPKPHGQARCRRGLEWIPSSIWQLFWSCLYGPYLLYKIKDVRDTHYWRLQTILCVVSGFPGSPMWLAALWSPKFEPINRYWVPPLWLAPGIIVMQAVTIFFPMYEARKSRAEVREMMDALNKYDEKMGEGTTLASGSTKDGKSSLFSREKSRSPTPPGTSYRGKDMFTMAALQKTLLTNPFPLLQFAATKDFTAENIIFLVQVQDWRAAFEALPQDSSEHTAAARALLFDKAVDIYAQSVGEKTAEFPINIEGPIRLQLDSVFESAAAKLQNDTHQRDCDLFGAVTSPSNSDMYLTALKKFPASIFQREISSDEASSAPSEAQNESPNTKDPENIAAKSELLDEKVFDAAENSIKYLVVTNTWRKFINAEKGHNEVVFGGDFS